MNATLKKAMTSMLFAGASAAAIALAPNAAGDPPCINDDGTACEVVTPDGASGQLPGPVQGGADGNNGAVGGSVPGGVWGEAGPDGAHGCVPIYGCRSVG
ncbi:hypothetical protein A5662_19500 [Mycobacteriaceae bacterium 1482268.1]|nr:hypothetical protein A5662_19500 [Mycobacteriaceae bacterium 1482268.1]